MPVRHSVGQFLEKLFDGQKFFLFLEHNFVIFPLNETAVTIDLGNIISEELNHVALTIQKRIVDHPFEGLLDVIVTYSSLTVFYDPAEVKKKNEFHSSVFEFIREKLGDACFLAEHLDRVEETDIIDIPVCYDDQFGYDLDFIALTNHLSKEEIINLHVSKAYYIYMIGFLPGFSYMASVDERLVIARKTNPVPVVAGSVGIAGSQTGIYPLNSPGGWQIIGRTPIKLFDERSDPPVLLRAGNRVRFYGITREKFDNWATAGKEIIQL